jgi:transposase-like protein
MNTVTEPVFLLGESMKKSRAEWRAMVEEQSESGLSQSAYSEREGVSLSSLRYWRGKFQRELEGKAAFIEVPPLEEASGKREIELELPHGIVLRLRGA